MKLNDLVRHIDHTGASDAEITAIVYDSRKAGAGALFVCLVGAWMDGHTFAQSAYDQGCRAFLAEHPLDLPADAAQIITEDTRAALAVIPLADWLEAPAACRMNTPGCPQGNWQWRAGEKELSAALARDIRTLTARYFRTPCKT